MVETIAIIILTAEITALVIREFKPAGGEKDTESRASPEYRRHGKKRLTWHEKWEKPERFPHTSSEDAGGFERVKK